MKTLRPAIALAVVGLFAPQIAFANETETTQTIIVSGEYQRAWEKGNQLEADGLRDLQRAQRDLVRYSADVVTAQDKRDTSLSRAENAREAFQSLTARPFFEDAKDARDWAKQVEEAASDWKRFDERSEEGSRELTRAQRRQTSAQAAVDDAQAKVAEGRALMADAERASQRVSLR